MPETDKREAVARLEARLRGDGWELVWGPDWREARGDLRKWTAIATGDDWNLNRFTGEHGAMESRPATPHDTDAGRLAWVELLRLSVVPQGKGRWSASTQGEFRPHEGVDKKALIRVAETPREAITAAIEAAAEQGARDA